MIVAMTSKFSMIDVEVENSEARAFILFVQTADAVLKYSEARLYKAGLSIAKFIVLQTLAANGGTMTPSAIARWTLREKHNVTTLIDRLQKDGFVVNEPNSTDKRSINVTLTDKGRYILNQTAPLARDIVRQVMLSININSIAAMQKILKKMRQNSIQGLENTAKH